MSRFRRAVLLPEGKNLFPPLRYCPDVVVMGAGDDLKIFRSLIFLKQTASGFHRNDFIGASENNFYRSSIVLEAFGGIEAVEQKQIRRKQGHLSLGHGSQIVIGHEKHETGDFCGMCPGQFTSHARADGFAHQIFGQAVGQQTKSFLSGGKETPFIRRTFTGAVPGIFEDVHINRPAAWMGRRDSRGQSRNRRCRGLSKRSRSGMRWRVISSR